MPDRGDMRGKSDLVSFTGHVRANRTPRTKETKVEKRRYVAHQVLYYDSSSGVPQIGHFVHNEANEANRAFFANEETEDMLGITARNGSQLTLVDRTGFMGQIPQVLAN